MENQPSLEVDIEDILGAVSLPATPDESFDQNDADLSKIISWNRNYVIAVLAGLATEPAFHANQIRLDWLQRLVFSKSTGRKKPKSIELSRVLNFGLERARVLRLEDPTEDLFCDLIATTSGSYRIFPGKWESAAPYTQTLLDAFDSLPSGALKRDTLVAIHSLLQLSDELAERAKICRTSPTTGEPQGMIVLPNDKVLKRLARRVRFTNSELGHLGINIDRLFPFLLETRHFKSISDREVGNTPLEFYPLLSNSNGVVIASPSCISMAVRAVLIVAAKKGGMDKILLSALLIEQQNFSNTSGFWPFHSLRLSPPNQHFVRTAICQFAPGRFIQVIQIPVPFDNFPDQAFATTRAPSQAAEQSIADEISNFWKFLNDQPDHRESISILYLSGWGTPQIVLPAIDHSIAPKDWRSLDLNFADAAVLGTCGNGNLVDVWRILKQVDQLERQGFSLQYMNGILNLFGFWQNSSGNLVPEHMLEIEPPCNLIIATNELYGPRIEASKKRDFRALPFPTGGFRLVQRVEHGDVDDLQPIYGSLADISEKRLLGAVVVERRTWWIECTFENRMTREQLYRIWNAVLQWLATIGHKIIFRFPQTFPAIPSKIEISVPSEPVFEVDHPSKLEISTLSETIIGSLESDGTAARIQLLPGWFGHLSNPENVAEIELIAAILEQISSIHALPISREELVKCIGDAINSKDWRWLHSRQVFTASDSFAKSGLSSRFVAIPMSAFSIIKCGSIWEMRARSDGLEINGEDECRSFLTLYRNHILDRLIAQVRKFNREKLMVMAADCYQAARSERSSWHGAIRAMRAIHGATADINAFKKQNDINAVQRAAKAICEIAACEAPHTGGVDPSRTDIDELFVRALLIFMNGQLFASMRAGLIKPTLQISPTGDLLSDRSVNEIMLKPEAEWVNLKALNEGSDSYGRDRNKLVEEAPEYNLTKDEVFRGAIEEEYGVSLEACINLQYDLIKIAEQKRKSTYVMRRSELSQLIEDNSSYDSSALLDRLTLKRRQFWIDRSLGLLETDIDLSRFDRPFSIINRPLLAIDDCADPLLLIAPMFVSDATMYSISGLLSGILHGRYWASPKARKYAGIRANALGLKFEESIAERLRDLNLNAWSRCKLSWALNEKVDNALGDIDVLAISLDRKRVWVIEAKNLKICRTEAEVAARLSEYQGKTNRDRKGRDRPDKMLRHIRRVQYLRQRNHALCERLKLEAPPEVRGLLLFDAPQPMNFYMLQQLEDGESAYLDTIDKFSF